MVSDGFGNPAFELIAAYFQFVVAGAPLLRAVEHPSIADEIIEYPPPQHPEARENFREDRAEAIAVVMGRIL